ncbi:MAG: T9SS type A sorting domain-containing protein, partial [Flavobacteriales bacterium]
FGPVWANEPNCVVAVGVDNIVADNNQALIYPNPASEQLNIVTKNNEILKRVYMYDSQGKLVFTKEMKNEQNLSVNVNSLNPGVYYVRIECNEHIYSSKKVVITR